jgi:hypothetical protein
MSTAPFVPTPFATPVVNPTVSSIFRRANYISVSSYQNAPTAVATNNLVTGNPGAQAQAAALATVISRASSWIDAICFARADGTLQASQSTEQGYSGTSSSRINVKPNGSVILICNYKPILEVDTIAVGPAPQQVTTLTQQAANTLVIGTKTISLPNVCFNNLPYPTYSPASWRGPQGLYVIWTYVNGFPHFALAQSASMGASSIVVNPTTPDGSSVFGVYPGTQLSIRDGGDTETIVVESASGLTINTVQPLQYAHTVPTAPDQILVSALPWNVEQACISLTSCLIKTRGTRAMVMPMAPGGQPPKQALIESGGLEDYDIARELLEPYITTFLPS